VDRAQGGAEGRQRPWFAESFALCIRRRSSFAPTLPAMEPHPPSNVGRFINPKMTQIMGSGGGAEASATRRVTRECVHAWNVERTCYIVLGEVAYVRTSVPVVRRAAETCILHSSVLSNAASRVHMYRDCLHPWALPAGVANINVRCHLQRRSPLTPHMYLLSINLRTYKYVSPSHLEHATGALRRRRTRRSPDVTPLVTERPEPPRLPVCANHPSNSRTCFTAAAELPPSRAISVQSAR